jgi:hypothetical protein
MPIVFVHGVNNRIEDSDYHKGIKHKTNFLRTLLAPRLGITSPTTMSIEFPYWGGEGVKFRWRHASLPSGSDKIESLSFGSMDYSDAIVDLWLREAQFQYGEEGVSLGKLSRQKGFDIAVDLIWDTAAAAIGSDDNDEQLLDAYLASLKYVAANPAPGWAMQDPPLDNVEFVNTLLRVIKPFTKEGGLEAFGIRNWLSSLSEAVSRLARAPVNALTSVAVGLGRKSAHVAASRFLGDIFVYLDTRGSDKEPGKILQDVTSKLRQAHAAKRIGDDKLIVIGHSLGGVMTYDILTHFAPDIQVDVFITVGSQVALFEEMTLYRISDVNLPPDPSKERLQRPANVARWLNVYDTNDVFSFRAAGVFHDVDDYRFDTGYGLAGAHGGYFERPSFYKRLAARLNEAAP